MKIINKFKNIIQRLKNKSGQTLQDISMTDLNMRRGILTEVIRQAKEDGDERWRDHPLRQLNEVVTEINRRQGLPVPENTTIQMDTLNLSGRQSRLGSK